MAASGPVYAAARAFLGVFLCIGLDPTSPAAAQDRPSLRMPPPEQIAADDPAVTDPSLLVVLIDPDAEVAGLIEVADSIGYGLRRQDSLAPLGLEMLSLEIPPGTTGPEAIQEIEALDPTATAGVNHRYELQEDPGHAVAPRFYANHLVGWPDKGCPAARTVGMLDGPIDLEAAVLRGSDLQARDFRTAPGGQVDTTHGTAVAELIAGPHRLRDTRLYAAVVADEENGAGVDDIVRGLTWTLENGADVINVSFAGPYNKLLDLGFARATARAITVVAAVGNDGPDAPPRYPAAFDDVIAVTAVDAARAPLGDAVQGPHVDVAAPGVDVWVEAGGGRYVTGTSFAAPFVTAAIAAGQSHETVDLGPDGPDATFGAGLLAVEGCPPS